MHGVSMLREPLIIEVYEEHKVFLDATRDILDFSDTVIAELNKKGIKPASIVQFDKVLLAWFFRQTLLSKQAWLLASGGQEVGTAIFVRSISEIRIKLEYVLHKGPGQFEALSEEFFQHGNAALLKDSRIALEICERLGDSPKALFTQRAIAQLESRLGERQKMKQWWPGRQLRQLAEDANCLRFYMTVFGHYSADVHSQPADMFRDHYDPSGLRWTLYVPPKRIAGLLYTIFECYVKMLDVVACQFWGHPFTRFVDFVAMQSELERELNQLHTDKSS